MMTEKGGYKNRNESQHSRGSRQDAMKRPKSGSPASEIRGDVSIMCGADKFGRLVPTEFDIEIYETLGHFRNQRSAAFNYTDWKVHAHTPGHKGPPYVYSVTALFLEISLYGPTPLQVVLPAISH